MRDRESQDTESKILEAAENEFMTKGFAGARTTSIAQRAGVTHAMLHYYFRTKEKLFERIVTEKLKMLKEIIGGSIEDVALSLEEILRRIIDSHLDFISANPYLPIFLITEIFGNPERMVLIEDQVKRMSGPVLKIIQKKIDEEASKGRCRAIDAKQIMLDIVSLNIFPYMATPMINAALDNYMADSNKFLSERKKENFKTIMHKLKP